MEEKKIILDIPAITIVKVVGVLAGLVLLYLIRDIIVLFFIVFVIVAALSPVVDRWSKKMPRIISVTLIYVIFLAVIVGAIVLVSKPVVNQIQSLSQNVPELISKVAPALDSYKNVAKLSQEGLASLSSNLSRFSSDVMSTTLGVLGGVVAVITILVLTFYLLLEEEGIRKFVKSVLPPTYKDSAIEAANKISIKMGSWFSGQLLLMFLVGFLDLIGLAILQVPYALTLAVWAAFTEVIPYVGPWIGLVPAAIIGFTVSPLLGVLVIALYLLVQQIEGQFLVPKIMGRAVGLSPVVIIFALLVGAKLLGILGVMLAVPAAGAISVIYEEWPKLKGLK